MREVEQWELEMEEIQATCSLEAKLDQWSGILAGLALLDTDEDFARLSVKALALAETDSQVGPAVIDRLDEIWIERRMNGGQRGR